jgi:mersacidin/lichenicidin family type 2 lantibiotic
MSNANIIRAWKDPIYRNSLSQNERAMLPENPAGIVELTDAQLEQASGGAKPTITCTWICTISCPTKLCTFSVGKVCETTLG